VTKGTGQTKTDCTWYIINWNKRVLTDDFEKNIVVSNLNVSLFHKNLHFPTLFFNSIIGLYAPFGPMAVFGCKLYLISVVQIPPPPHTGISVRHVLMRITQIC